MVSAGSFCQFYNKNMVTITNQNVHKLFPNQLRFNLLRLIPVNFVSKSRGDILARKEQMSKKSTAMF